ncbi:MAG: hypothetical protein CMI16_07060 [Opitutaceae bacterium]|nr:hypothetical protein [Opitutaceae bacterium]
MRLASQDHHGGARGRQRRLLRAPDLHAKLAQPEPEPEQEPEPRRRQEPEPEPEPEPRRGRALKNPSTPPNKTAKPKPLSQNR